MVSLRNTCEGFFAKWFWNKKPFRVILQTYKGVMGKCVIHKVKKTRWSDENKEVKSGCGSWIYKDKPGLWLYGIVISLHGQRRQKFHRLQFRESRWNMFEWSLMQRQKSRPAESESVNRNSAGLTHTNLLETLGRRRQGKWDIEVYW